MSSYYQVKKKVKRTKWIEFLLGISCTLLILLQLFVHIPIFSDLIVKLDNQIYDKVVQLNLRAQPQNPNVVIIDINEESVKQVGRWPWPRDKMAKLISILKESGMVTIGLDIIMSEAETNFASALQQKLLQYSANSSKQQNELISALNNIKDQVDNDQVFMHALTDKNIVLGFLFQYEQNVQKGSLPPPLRDEQDQPINPGAFDFYNFPGYDGILDSFIKTSTQGGFVTNLPDSDGTVRRSIAMASNQGKLYPSLSLAIAMNYLMMNHVKLDQQNGTLTGITLDGTTIPTNARGQILIPFWGQAGSLPYYSASDILNHRFNPDDLSGSIGVVGSSMILLSDLHPTPAYQLFPGVEMVGNLVKGIVSQQIPYEFTWHSVSGGLIILLLGLLLSSSLAILYVVGKLILSSTFLLGSLGASVYLFHFNNVYFPSAILVALISLLSLSNLTFSYINERRQKKEIRQLFGQYVPEDYVSELLEAPEHHSMEGQTRNMTVLFSDIRNFTTISEGLDATEVKNLLNSFFTPITELIFNNKGTIDKYVGDMVISFWGAPMEDLEHASHAVSTSLTIIEQLPIINQELFDKGLPPLQIGVGLATGLMNVGDMGSKFRRAYTVIGDTVNLASRLQDLTKFYKVPILTSEATRLGQDKFIWRPIDKVAVKGRTGALTIYQPLGMVTDTTTLVEKELGKYLEGLNFYYLQNWKEAEACFNELIENAPGTYLYKLYLDRITQFRKTPPPEMWDGIFIHSHK